MSNIGIPGFSNVAREERARLQFMVDGMRAKEFGLGTITKAGAVNDETAALIDDLEAMIGKLDTLIANYSRMRERFNDFPR